MPYAYITRSDKSGKKYKIITYGHDKKKIKTIHIGQAGASDFTQHRSEARKQLYINRHRANENWGKSGWNTAGFWAKWLLWNKTTLEASNQDIERKFGIKIISSPIQD
jgi:hypothetical protein